MADTSQVEQLPQTNGLNACEDDDERGKMRPADIDADMREMERRKRVELIMNSRLFREELERIIETQMKDGGAGTSGLLQQISDMMGIPKHSGNMFKQSNCVVPINDIRGVESMGYAKGEKILRCKLAAVFRLMDLYGWSQGVSNQITARLNQDQEHFLVNPYGMLYHELTASSLVKIDMQGNVVEQGTTNFGVNITGFSLHAAIHAARPDIKCVIQVHMPSVLAVSALKCGLLPISQESIVIGEVSVHPFMGGLAEPEEREKVARNLGPLNKVLFLTNHGAVCCGETVEEAFFNVYNTVLACETQLKLMPMGVDNLVLVSDETRKQVYDAARRAPDGALKSDHPAILAEKLERKWRVGGVEFEALMRMLDNAGFRTGYIYRHPLVKGEPPRPRNDVEVPPAVSSLGYLLEEEEMYKQGIWKPGRKGTDRTRWLNSPNVYQKVEILETGTPDPKKITKWVDANADEWVADGSPTHSSTPVKIDSALQFVPKNTNPKEFKQLQQQIKDNRRADKISAGPQSHILEGVTWEEARKMQDAGVTHTSDQVVLLGAASKGIIQRGFQHHATVYKAPYAKNPFDSVTDEELDEYKKVIERKARGEYDTDFSESEGLSSAQISKRVDENNLRSPTSATSETEEESRDEPQVLCIETKQAPKPSQPEVVLSDGAMGNRRGEICYRTESYAGMPRGSYLNPNPKHFHVPQKTSVHVTVQTEPNPAKTTEPEPEPTDTCLYFASDNKLVKLDISLQVVKEFIEPINTALHPTTSVSCQTESSESASTSCDKFDEKTMLKAVHSRLFFDITRDNESDFDVSLCCSSEELAENPEMKLFSRCSSMFGEAAETAIDSGLCEEVQTLRDGSNTENYKENFDKDENQNVRIANTETDNINETGLLNVDSDLINLNIDKEFDRKHRKILEEDAEQFLHDLIGDIFNDISSENTDNEPKNEVELTENVVNHNILSELQDVTSNLKNTSDDLKILTSDLKTSIVDLKNVSEDIKRTVNIDKTISDITVDYEQIFNDNLDANSSAEVEIEATLCDYVQNDIGYQQFRQNLNEYLSLYTSKFSKLSDMLTAAIFDFISTVCVETIDSLDLPHFRCYHGAPHLFDILLNIFQPFSSYFDKPYKRSKLVKKIQHLLMHKMKDEVLLETDQTDKILKNKLASVKKFVSIVMYIHFSNFDWPDLQCTHTNMMSYESTSDLDLSFQSTPDQTKYYSSFFMEDTDETLIRKPGDGASDVYNLYDRVKAVNDDDSTTGFLHKKNDTNVKYWVTVDFKRKRTQSEPCLSEETLDCKRRFSLPVLDTKRSLSPIYEEPVQPVKLDSDSENDTTSCSTSNLSTLKYETGRKIHYEQKVTFIPKKIAKLDNTSDDVSSDIFNETFEIKQDSDSDVDWMGYEAAKF